MIHVYALCRVSLRVAFEMQPRRTFCTGLFPKATPNERLAKLMAGAAHCCIYKYMNKTNVSRLVDGRFVADSNV